MMGDIFSNGIVRLYHISITNAEYPIKKELTFIEPMWYHILVIDQEEAPASHLTAQSLLGLMLKSRVAYATLFLWSELFIGGVFPLVKRV